VNGGQVVSGRLGDLQAGEVRVHHEPVALHGKDQRHIDRNALANYGGDRRQAVLHRRDLDEEIGPVDDLPQLDGLLDRLVGVVREARIHLNGHSAVDTVRGIPLRL
jgi:hypothetical protein